MTLAPTFGRRWPIGMVALQLPIVVAADLGEDLRGVLRRVVEAGELEPEAVVDRVEHLVEVGHHFVEGGDDDASPGAGSAPSGSGRSRTGVT